jgi:hypothetical protein
VPPQDSPQIEVTSPTHMLSHWWLQQYESLAHIFVTHESQPDLSRVPVEHSLCEHVPLPPLLLPELLPEPLLDVLPELPPPDPPLPLVLPLELLLVLPLVLPLLELLLLELLLLELLLLELPLLLLLPPLSRRAPFGVPHPVGPSYPAPELHRYAGLQLPLLPEVTSKKSDVWLQVNAAGFCPPTPSSV